MRCIVVRNAYRGCYSAIDPVSFTFGSSGGCIRWLFLGIIYSTFEIKPKRILVLLYTLFRVGSMLLHRDQQLGFHKIYNNNQNDN